MNTNKSTIVAIGLLVIFGLTAYTQQTSDPLSLDNSPIEGQFQYVYQKSTDFEEYKMVRRWYLTRLKSHVLDSLKEKEDLITQARGHISTQKSEIDSLVAAIHATDARLITAIKEKNTFTMLGIPIQKTGYSSLVWSIIAVLAFSLVILVLLYKRSYSVITHTKNDLDETRSEFEAFRKRALEREEGIVRKYHNELMKYKSKVSK